MSKPNAKLKDRYVIIDGIPTIRRVSENKPIPYLAECIDTLPQNDGQNINVWYNGQEIYDWWN